MNVIVPSTSHPRLLHIIKPPSELDEKRIERESLHGSTIPKDMEQNQSFIGCVKDVLCPAIHHHQLQKIYNNLLFELYILRKIKVRVTSSTPMSNEREFLCFMICKMYYLTQMIGNLYQHSRYAYTSNIDQL